MSKTRSSSAASAVSSQNSGVFQASAWRVGASRLPSRAPPGGRSLTRANPCAPGSAELVQRLLEAVRVRALGLRERLEPVGDLAEALVARCLGHARVHVRVLVRFARDRGLQVVGCGADRQPGRRVADLLEVLEMAVCMSGFTFRRRTKNGCDVVVTLDVSLLCEVKVTTVRLRLAGKCRLEVALGLAALEIHDVLL